VDFVALYSTRLKDSSIIFHSKQFSQGEQSNMQPLTEVRCSLW
jgi:hypothetical protein